MSTKNYSYAGGGGGGSHVPSFSHIRGQDPSFGIIAIHTFKLVISNIGHH